MKRLCKLISDYMGVLVLAAAVVALLLPSVLQQIPTKVINYMLGVVMFGMGLTLNLRDFKIVFSRPKDVIVGPYTPQMPCIRPQRSVHRQRDED